MNYHYCEGYWNRGWGRYESSDYVGGVDQNAPHNHADGESHCVCVTFDQLFGGSSNGSGHYPVRGLREFEGVTVNYPESFFREQGYKAEGDNYIVYSGDGFKYVATEVLADASKNVTIELANDIDLDSTINVANGQTVTIDLNGHNITSEIAGKPSESFGLFSVNGELEINGNGTISLTSEDFEWNSSYRYTAINIREKGVVTLGEGVSVICEASKDGSYGMSYAVDIYTTGKLNINGASLHSNYIAVRCFFGNSVVNVNSGSKITSSKNNYGIWLQSSPGAVVNIADDVNYTVENDIYYFN